MLRRINNYIFPNQTPLTFLYPRRWWNCMRSSCWNAPAVSVLLGLIGGVCWASHGHTGLASDPTQLLSIHGPATDIARSKPSLQSREAHLKNIALTLRGSWPRNKCMLAYLVGKSTCHLAESLWSEKKLQSCAFSADLSWDKCRGEMPIML